MINCVHKSTRNNNLLKAKIVGSFIRKFAFQLAARRRFIARLREPLPRYEQSYIRVFIGDASASRWRYYVAKRTERGAAF